MPRARAKTGTGTEKPQTEPDTKPFAGITTKGSLVKQTPEEKLAEGVSHGYKGAMELPPLDQAVKVSIAKMVEKDGIQQWRHNDTLDKVTYRDVITDLSDRCRSLATEMKNYGTGNVIIANEEYHFIELLLNVSEKLDEIRKH